MAVNIRPTLSQTPRKGVRKSLVRRLEAPAPGSILRRICFLDDMKSFKMNLQGSESDWSPARVRRRLPSGDS